MESVVGGIKAITPIYSSNVYSQTLHVMRLKSTVEKKRHSGKKKKKYT